MVHASVDEQERDQFARWSEWVVRHGEQRDVLQELVRDGVERCAHCSVRFRSCDFLVLCTNGEMSSDGGSERTTLTDGDHLNDEDSNPRDESEPEPDLAYLSYQIGFQPPISWGLGTLATCSVSYIQYNNSGGTFHTSYSTKGAKYNNKRTQFSK
jgi:hypothetical protein